MMMYGMDGGWGIWAWVLMGLVFLVFWGGLAALVVFLVRGGRAGGHGPASGAPDDSERILRERFARGEIDETEFTARTEALRRRQ